MEYVYDDGVLDQTRNSRGNGRRDAADKQDVGKLGPVRAPPARLVHHIGNKRHNEEDNGEGDEHGVDGATLDVGFGRHGLLGCVVAVFGKRKRGVNVGGIERNAGQLHCQVTIQWRKTSSRQGSSVG